MCFDKSWRDQIFFNKFFMILIFKQGSKQESKPIQIADILIFLVFPC